MSSLRAYFEGYGEIIIACVLWSSAGILAKMIIGMPAQSIIFYRGAFASVIFFMALLISGNLRLVKLGDKKMYMFIFGILQGATMLAFFISVLNASVSVAVLLLYTAPVYVTVFSPGLLKERSTRTGIIALIISITGVLLMVDPAKLEFPAYSIGILAAILSGITYAFQIMTSKYLSKTYSGYTQSFWGSFIVMLMFLPFSIIPKDVVLVNLKYLIVLSIFPTILAISLYFNGLKKLNAQSASILGLIEPLSAVILAVLILHEEITTAEIAGGALILAGAALAARDR